MFQQVSLFSCAIMAVCLLQIQAIPLQRFADLNNNDSPVTADLSQLEQFLVSVNVDESSRQSTNGTASSGLSTLISGLLSGLTTAITPALGPFAPLATIGAPLVNSAITGLLTNALSGLGGLLRREDLPDSGYETYMLNIPNQGSYILMAKKPEPVVPTMPAQQPQYNNLLFGNQQNPIHQLTGLQSLLTSNALMGNQQPTYGTNSQQKNNLILVPLGQMNGMNGLNGLNGILTQQQGRSSSSESNF